MAEWWEWLPGWIGLAGGTYGAWRARKTQREIARVSAKWEGTCPDVPNTMHVRSLLPYRALDVRVSAVEMILDDMGAEPSDGAREPRDFVERDVVEPRDVIELHIVRFLNTPSHVVTVEWRHSWTWWRRREIVAIPPMPDFWERQKARRDALDL